MVKHKLINKPGPRDSVRRKSKISRFITMKTIYAGIALLITFTVVCMFIPLSHIEYAREGILPETITREDSNLELGESTTSQGIAGDKIITLKSKRTLFDLLFRKNSIKKIEVASEIIKKPTNTVIKNGTKKYQYMYCSNGGYHFYTDEQFKSKYTGFTSKSEDYCAKNNEGTKKQLANVPPATTQRSTQSIGSKTYDIGLTAPPPVTQPYATMPLEVTPPKLKPYPKSPYSAQDQAFDYCRDLLIRGKINGQMGFTNCMNQNGF